MDWIVFSSSLPAQARSSPRVTVWRRLRRLGAVTPAGSISVLPAHADCVEALQWLAQEIRQAGGEAVVMHVTQFDGLPDQAVVELFQAARADQYRALDEEASALEARLQAEAAADDRAALQDAVARLHKQYREIARIDYFAAPAGPPVAARLARLQQALAPAAPAVAIEAATLAAYRDARWVTRPRPHVDRLACAWLIRRFVNPDAAIRYARDVGPEEVPFDMEGARFGHQGSRCSFETLLEAFGLEDGPLRALAEIIHDIDLRDGVTERPEVAGIDAVLHGWLLGDRTDAEREAHGLALFDGLHAALAAQLARQATAADAQRP